MRQDSLEQAQQAARVVRRLVWGSVLLAVALAAASIAVSPTRRRTLVQLGLGLAGGLVIALRVTTRLEAAALARITDPDRTLALGALTRELAADLRTISLLVAVVALAVAILALLAGRHVWLTSLTDSWPVGSTSDTEVRAIDRWIRDHHGVLRVTGFVLAGGLLAALAVDLLPLMVTAAVLGLYLWAIGAARSRVEAAEPDSGGPAVDRDTTLR